MHPAPQSLSEILVIEDSDEILAARCARTDIPLWVPMRQHVIRMMLGRMFYDQPLVNIANGLRQDFGRKIKAVGYAARHALTAPTPRAATAIYASGAGNILVDGRFFNRLSDYFAVATPDDSVCIEELFQWRWPFPRHNDRFASATPAALRQALVGRAFEKRYLGRADEFIALVEARLVAHLGERLLDAERAWLTRALARWMASVPSMVGYYRDQLHRIGARLVLREEGCYGHSAPLMVAARSLGVRTAEYQHGLVTAGHDAYNCAPALQRSSAYARTLPEFFLAYGDWWRTQVSTPVRSIAIGNPYREETLRTWRHSGGRGLLILGDGIDTEASRRFCAELAARGLHPRFRPHPIERPRVVGASQWNGIEIDTSETIYDAFVRSDAVVSEISTGLFEAIGLVRRIFVWDTPKSRFTIPGAPFDAIDSAEALASALATPDAGLISDDLVGAVWAKDWATAFKGFRREMLGG